MRMHSMEVQLLGTLLDEELISEAGHLCQVHGGPVVKRP